MFEPIDLGWALTCLRGGIDKLELQFAEIAAQFEESEGWADAGYDSAADWMRFNCHMNSNQAWASLAVGEHMPKLAESMQAMKDGEVGYAHVATMGRTAEAIGEAFDEAALLPMARKFTPGKFFHKVVHYRHALDARAYNEEQEQVAEERSLRIGTREDGCVLVSGLLDPVGGAAVRNSLEPLAKPSGAHDHRTREQRMADALVE